MSLPFTEQFLSLGVPPGSGESCYLSLDKRKIHSPDACRFARAEDLFGRCLLEFVHLYIASTNPAAE